MATVRTDLGYGEQLDMLELFVDMLRGSYETSKGSFTVSRNGSQTELAGSGLSFSDKGVPVGGAVTALSEWRDGNAAWEIDGFKASANAMARAAASRGTGDDIKVLASMFSGNDRFTGGKSDDHFYGFAGHDKMDGGKGDDTLSGGAGCDTLKGGLGYDTFVFDTELDPKTNVDTITDFSDRDTIVLDSSVFEGLDPGFVSAASLSGVPGGTGPSLIYNQNKGDLYFDADGTGGEPPIKFIHFANHDKINLSHLDFFVV